ncbi:hypothetical protein [Photobacterium phosphoreum]|uniref:hypothetical protein n=1 Tax=Photobacterium phosphoreum TaxID=659 RepID=UPI000D1811CA|nr:hypothetical protein [Photobacterium phosphoreum]PSU40517.1 hypothetical protein CTM85_01405 [Photobacterium phosphoreum]
MHRKTLSLNKNVSKKTIKLPTDYDRLLQSITVCAPSQKIGLDIDITHKITLPAIIESALLLIAQIEIISPNELGGFFGLTDHERHVLVNEIIDTDLVRFNDQGEITTTKKLVAQRREGAADGGITIEDVENFRDFTFVDLCTGHIQPRSEADKQQGLPVLARKINLRDFSQIIANQFQRFQACLPDIKSKRALRSPKARLYRINRTSVIQSGIQQQISLDIHAHYDPLDGIRLEARLLDYKNEHANLLNSSGLKTEAVDWIHNRTHEPTSMTFQQYCDLALDPILKNYIKKNDTLDLPNLLHDRHCAKTSYRNQHTRMVIGPIYSATNRDVIISWVKRQSKNSRMHHGIWLGASNQLFGASLGFELFIKQVNLQLNKGDRNSSINLAFHLEEKNNYNERLLLKNTFSKRSDNKLCVFSKGVSESHMEIIVFPGNNGCALIQYHAKIDKNLGFSGLTIPIGYFTTDPNLVTHLWEQVRNKINSPILSFYDNDPKLDHLNKQLECNPDALDKLLEDETTKKLQELMNKFNN